MQGIPIEVATGHGKGALRDTAHMSETSPSAIVRAQANKDAIEHELLGGAALADQGPDEMGQGQFAAARESAGNGASRAAWAKVSLWMCWLRSASRCARAVLSSVRVNPYISCHGGGLCQKRVCKKI